MASNNFINECKQPTNDNRYATIKTNNNILNQDNYIQDFTIDSGCYVDGTIIGTTCVKKINANLIGSYNIDLENEDLDIQVGVKYEDETTEYINLGKYKVETPKDEATNNYSSITAYDHLLNKLDNAYICNLDFTTPKTYLDLYKDLCLNLGLTSITTTFDNDNLPLSGNPFTNNETNRIILQTIEKVSCTFAQINVDTNQIELCWLSQNNTPDYTFGLDDYTSLEGGKIVYGPINSLILKSSYSDSENVSISDDESINKNGEHQLVITDDYLLYSPEIRERAITAIWNKVHNLTYVDCTLTTYYGKPFLKIGDKIRVYKDEEKYFDTYVLTHQFKYDGSFYSKITSPVLTKQQIAIKQDISLGKTLRDTKIEVDKINGKIREVVEKTEQLEKSVDILNPKLDNNSIIISTNENRIPFSNKTYTINFTTEFVGSTVSVIPVTSDSYTGIEVSTTNNSITFSVTNNNAIQNEANKYVFTWSYEFDGITYTQTRVITINTLISESEQNIVISDVAPSDTNVLWFNIDDNQIYIYDTTSNKWVESNNYDEQLNSINEKINGADGLSSQITSLQDNVQGISDEVKNKVDNGEYTSFKTSITTTLADTYKKDEVNAIVNGTGVDGVTVTAVKISQSATFDINGMHYQKTGEDSVTTINQSGLTVQDKNNNELLFAGVRSGSSESIVETKNLKVDSYLISCNNTGRMEKFQDVSEVAPGTHSGPALFVIGGN